MTFIVYAKCGRDKNSLKDECAIIPSAKDWEDARSQGARYFRNQGYTVVRIETVQEVEKGKQPWEK